jgi:alpha-glutamyl/putrescinyl thymine pyrophosphorylase clade 1
MPMTPSCVHDTYWRFAAERQAVYLRRLSDHCGPWTTDPVLRNYRFTNVYRAADRVSQYLIREILYREGRSQSPIELFFRTLLFKLFNKIETWCYLERLLGPLSWQSTDLNRISLALGALRSRGERVYSAAYIMPSPAFGHERKHDNHLALLARMIEDGLPAQLVKALSLRAAYEMIRPYPGLGPFLAFQYVIDLNYSTMLDFDEADFVVAGPGALDGIAKCFTDIGRLAPPDVIYHMVDRQQDEFARLGLRFDGLFGRPLKPIDCQNLFCEISKYARVAHPEVRGVSARRRIKQAYRPSLQAQERPVFPPRWGLSVPVSATAAPAPLPKQLELI